MKAFIQKLLLFLLPLVFGVVFLLYGPPNKQQGYNYMLKSCEKGNWLYNRIFEHETPVDIAFLGTSRTICGLNDSTIEQDLSTIGGAIVHVSNLAFCRPGRSLDYVILKDLFKHHQPKLIVLEIREKEDRFNHRDFPYIADGGDVLFQHLLLNQRYFGGIHLAIDRRFQYYRQKVMGTTKTYPDEASSYHHRVADLYASPESLINSSTNKQKDPYDNYTQLKQWRERVNQKLGMSYVKAITSMARKNGTAIVFLYLPSFKEDQVFLPRNYESYLKLGPVILPPDSLITNMEHWADPNHMNLKGSKLISRFLAIELAKVLDQ